MRSHRNVLSRSSRRAPFLALALVLALALGDVSAPVPAIADDAQFGGRPGEATFRKIGFPVKGGAGYSDTWHAPRSGGRKHLGQDLFAPKHTALVAVRDARVSWLRVDDAGLAGRMLTLRDDDGWQYRYIHLNNDSRGTDDGEAPASLTIADGIERGARVRAGQVIAYAGDSGNAEGSAPHTHFEILDPRGRHVNPYPSLRLSQGLRVGNRCRFDTNPPSHPRDAGGTGYYLLDGAGGVFTYGDARYRGSVPGLRNQGHAVGPARAADLSVTATGDGYWVLDEEGGVFTFGDARFFGSVPGLRAEGQRIGQAGIAGMVSDPDGRGYAVMDDRGGIFAFGGFDYHGSVPGTGLCDWAPVTDAAPTATGGGYWMVGADGRVWAFGDARYLGAGDVGSTRPAEVVALAPTPV